MSWALTTEYVQQQDISLPSVQSHTSDITATGGIVSLTVSTTRKNEIPEKEKKRKELSSSRQKKFNRHFQQVCRDEKILNYFSCALVSDILLQGHLYITKNYFAFYSNVFGFITKLLIPTSSVIKVSKEKTAKIIPNAIGVATIDERHVFGSFMSREAAFRLMCSVCLPHELVEVPKIYDVEILQESNEDDSSCSISGNESPTQLLESTGVSTGGCSATTGSSDASQSLRYRSLLSITKGGAGNTIVCNKNEEKVTVNTSKILLQQQQLPISLQLLTNPSSIIKNNKTSLASEASQWKYFIKFKYPPDFHVVYLGIILTIILALFSGFLMYRILVIEAKASFKPIDFKKSILINHGESDFSKTFKWQKELQIKSIEEAQIILNSNLNEIAKVRKSLETLSILIHDKTLHLNSDQSDGLLEN